MGLLTDAFAATEAEVAAADFTNHDPAGLFATVQAKRVDDLKLATLDGILTGQKLVAPELDPEASVRGVEERFILVRNIGAEQGDEAEGPWISRFPESLVARLAQLTSDEIARYGETWANTDEWRLDGVNTPEQAADVVRLLQEYCRLAAHAQTEGRRLYMWTSL
jgi:hypothetical protein